MGSLMAGWDNNPWNEEKGTARDVCAVVVSEV